MSKFTLGAFAIIFDENNRVLLCHRRDLDVWNLPGGGVEVGELPTQTVQREVREETCLDVEIVRLAGIYAKSSNPSDLVFSFICRVTGGAIALTDEADEIDYFSLDSLPKNTVPNQVERIFDAIKYSLQPVFIHQINMSTQEWLKKLDESPNHHLPWRESGKTDKTFWQAMADLTAGRPFVIDRPAGSTHPRYPGWVYPLDYGYVEGTTSGDGSGIDIWVGSLPERSLTGILCTYDSLKRDAEIKLLLGCSAQDIETVLEFSQAGMSTLFIPNPNH